MTEETQTKGAENEKRTFLQEETIFASKRRKMKIRRTKTSSSSGRKE